MVINTTKGLLSNPAGKDVKKFLINLREEQDWSRTVAADNFAERFIAGIFL